MSLGPEARYFEKSSGGVVWRWQISREGIRCRMTWGQAGGQSRSSSMTLDDEAQAERHFNKKVSEKKRQGYTEVAPGAAAELVSTASGLTAAASLLDVMRVHEEQRYEGAWDFYWTGYEPVDSCDRAFVKFHDFSGGPGSFYEYLVLSEDERRGLRFVVKKPGRDPGAVEALLDFVRPRLALAFDGPSHHKVPLPSPVGRFDHVLFCAPSLCGNRYDGRLGEAIPVLDCEISDEDTESVVEARLRGRGSMPSTTWDREPFPVTDLKFDLRSENGFGELGGTVSVREKTFTVYRRSDLERGMRLLAEALTGSWLEVRNYRREVMTLTRASLTSETPDEIDRFLLGGQ